MQTIKQGTLTLTCKSEHVADLRIKLEKADKAAKRKPSIPRNPSRSFPKNIRHLYSTAKYVQAYLSINNLNYRYNNDDIFTGYTLNTAPTTQPEGEECIYSEEVEAS